MRPAYKPGDGIHYGGVGIPVSRSKRPIFARDIRARMDVIVQAEKAIIGCDKNEITRLIKICSKSNFPATLKRLEEAIK